MPLKAQFGQKLARDVMYYHNRIIQRFEKNGFSRQSCRLPDSSIRGSRFSNTNISANSKPKSEQLKMQCKGPRPKRFMQTDRQTDRKTDFEIFTSTVLYCSFLLYSKYSTYVVLNALYYILGGGDLRGTLGPKSSYFCT